MSDRTIHLPAMGKVPEKCVAPATLAPGCVQVVNLSTISDETRAMFGRAATRMKALLDAEEEFYRTRPIRRLRKRLGLLPDPDVKARVWALEHVGSFTDTARGDR